MNKQEWQPYIEEWKTTGMNKKAFAEMKGVSSNAFSLACQRAEGKLFPSEIRRKEEIKRKYVKKASLNGHTNGFQKFVPAGTEKIEIRKGSISIFVSPHQLLSVIATLEA